MNYSEGPNLALVRTARGMPPHSFSLSVESMFRRLFTKNKKEIFRVRPGYGTHELLIEFKGDHWDKHTN